MQIPVVAIIGAGMAGLSAARRLSQAGCRIVLYEKSRGVGGRVATRRIEGCILDHGAQVIKPVGTPLMQVMQEELPTEHLVQVTSPVRLYASQGAILPPDPQYAPESQYSYRHGITTLPKLLLAALPSQQVALVTETRISHIEATDEQFTLKDEEGSELGKTDAVILTATAPQSADLLASSPPLEDSGKRIKALRSVAYASCLTVLLGYAPPAPEPPAYALLSEDRSRPLLWLAFEQVKAWERAPNGEALLIAQFGPEYSRENYGANDDEIIGFTLGELRGLFGNTYGNPLWSQVKRWRYAQPMGMVSFEEVNPQDTRTVVCGDALRPENGRVHQAYLSGIAAAEHLLRLL